MLAEIYVENFALIEALRIEFCENLNIISGETGAGKSLLTDAVGLLMGGRGEKEQIRAGAKKTLVEAVFHGPFFGGIEKLLEKDDLEDGIIIVSREIQTSGKNICRLNRRQIPLSFLKDITAHLLILHNQFAHIGLMKEQHQLELLDRYGGERLDGKKKQMETAYQSWRKAKHDLSALEAEREKQAQEFDFLRFQQNELSEAALRTGEREELERELSILENSQTIYEAGMEAYDALYGADNGNARDMVYRALAAVERILPYDQSLALAKESLNDIYYNLEDIAETMRRYGEDLERDPRHMEEVEERLARIKTLEKKYRRNTDELLTLLDEIKARLERFENIDNLLATVKEDEKQASLVAIEKAAILSETRKDASRSLAADILGQLRELLLPDAKFEASIAPNALGPNGADQVEFMISLNPGEELKPLKKVASGGEMSRIILGMQVILAELGQVGTMVFDEIDSGLGGKAAAKVGEKLQALGNGVQVIAVTHSPLVAAVADRHFYIEKTVTGGKTTVNLSHLTGKAVKQEIARMITGDSESDITLNQAEALLRAKAERGVPNDG